MLIELKGIGKTYGEGELKVPVLFDVNLSIQQGEYVSIMGPSGSGKSTLMNILGCLDRQSEGTFLFNNQDISHCSDNELSNIRLDEIGFVFQSFHLLPRQSALENVSLPLIYKKVNRLERISRATKALESVGLGNRIHFKPNQLSGGQKQRVAIARAMINEPKLILADEPTGALDQSSGKQVLQLFKELNQNGVTIITITHDESVARHADRILRMVDGRLIEDEKNNQK